MESGERKVEIVSGKSYSELTRASHSGAPSVPKPWSFNDGDAKRRKRLAKYKVYTLQGKLKATLTNGFRWIKNQCSQIVHGY